MYIWLIKSTLYNFINKLRSGFEQENGFTANKWTRFDIQTVLRIIFLWTRVILQTLLDYTKPGRAIGYLIDTVQPPSISETYSNGTLTSYFHVSCVVHLESSSHIWMCILIHGRMLSLLSKQKRSKKGSAKIRLIGVDNKMILDMLMKYFYIAV